VENKDLQYVQSCRKNGNPRSTLFRPEQTILNRFVSGYYYYNKFAGRQNTFAAAPLCGFKNLQDKKIKNKTIKLRKL